MGKKFLLVFFVVIIFICIPSVTATSASIFTNSTLFDQATQNLDEPTIIDFNEIDASPINNAAYGRTPLAKEYYRDKGFEFSSPQNYDLFVAPGGLFWNPSNSLSPGGFPFDSASRPSFDNNEDDLIITLDPACQAFSFKIVDLGATNSSEYVEFLDKSGDLIAQKEFLTEFIGVVSIENPVSEVIIKENPNPNDNDDITYDDFTCFPVDIYKQNIVFSEDFEDGEMDTNPHWEYANQAWEIVNGELHADGLNIQDDRYQTWAHSDVDFESNEYLDLRFVSTLKSTGNPQAGRGTALWLNSGTQGYILVMRNGFTNLGGDQTTFAIMYHDGVMAYDLWTTDMTPINFPDTGPEYDTEYSVRFLRMHGSLCLYIDNRYLGCTSDPVNFTNFTSVHLHTFGSVIVDDISISNERPNITKFWEDFSDNEAYHKPEWVWNVTNWQVVDQALHPDGENIQDYRKENWFYFYPKMPINDYLEFSVRGYLKSEGNPQEGRAVYFLIGEPGNNYGIYMSLGQTNYLTDTFFLHHNGQNIEITSLMPSRDQFYELRAIITNGDWDFYVDDVLVGTIPNALAANAISQIAVISIGSVIIDDIFIKTDNNIPPIADAGGPYSVHEGETLILDASDSYDLDGDNLTYAWDLDGDGEYDDATGITAGVNFPVDGVYTIGLEVSDSKGGYDYDKKFVRVINAILPVTELLTNTSFEIYIPVGWQDGKFIVSTEGPDCGSDNHHTGNCAWRFNGDGSSKRIFMRYKLNGMAGDSFNLSIYRKGISVPIADGAFIKATLFYADGTQESIKMKLDTGTIDTWEQLTLPFIATKDYNRVNLDLFYKKASGTMWLDDISLKRNGAGELLDNVSFELYKPDDWVLAKEIDPGEGPDCRTGNALLDDCALIFIGSSTSKRLLRRDIYAGSAGDDLTISIWRKGLGVPAAAGAYVKVKIFYTDGTSDIIRMDLDTGNLSVWEKFTTEFVAAKDYKRFNIDLFYKKNSGTLWLDDISLLVP